MLQRKQKTIHDEEAKEDDLTAVCRTGVEDQIGRTNLSYYYQRTVAEGLQEGQRGA